MHLTKNQKTTLILAIFFALVGIFVVIMSLMFIPAFRKYMRPIFIPASITFFLLGLALTILAVKEKDKKFLILTGGSSVGFFVSVLLHNLFYGLATITTHISVLSYLMEVVHMIFFIIGIFVCPVGFLVGVVGNIILLIKKRKND